MIPDATYVRPTRPGQWSVLYSGNVYITTYPGPTTFETFVQTLTPWESELLHMLNVTCDAFAASEALSHGVRAVSDRSVWDEHQGAFGGSIS